MERNGVKVSMKKEMPRLVESNLSVHFVLWFVGKSVQGIIIIYSHIIPYKIRGEKVTVDLDLKKG